MSVMTGDGPDAGWSGDCMNTGSVNWEEAIHQARFDIEQNLWHRFAFSARIGRSPERGGAINSATLLVMLIEMQGELV